ncbi:RPA family protein [Halobaculum limi]|uniref:RPA family protein n=1 Tax=Halobaculum limi TaxID=3031916 RepID=UPI002406925A|nr:hypothetical protein [Halobaculum sp. YSMS11]
MSSSDGGDGGPGTREVAHRIFAAEFDDADFDYSESDEERAPNYVVTPTGLRVNRLFTVGVLTEVETVNEQTLRGRVVDPTGAFVTYAGQYQPDEMAFLDRTSPPAFVALTGKARTFQPEDSDLVYTSVRPESFATVDADTRDRWTVSAAEATLRRIAVFAAALEAEERGDALRERLENAGVPTALASGIPLAIDHYDTGTRYLEAVRTLAVDALEVVADERDQVRDLTADPGDRGEAALGPLPDVPYDVAGASVSVDAVDAVDTTAQADAEPAAADTDAAASTDSMTADSDAATETESAAEPAEAVGDEPSTADVAEADPGAGAEPEPVESATATGTDDTAAETSDSATSAESTSTAASEATDAAASTDSLTETPTESDATTAADTASEPAEAVGSDTDDAAAAEVDPSAGAEPEPVESDGDDLGGLGDFEDTDDGLGDFEDTESSDDADDAPAVDPDADPEDFEDALSDEERREVEEEHGVEFATGSEVPDPGEAGIETPDPEEVAPEEDRDVSDDPDTEPEPAAAATEPATDTTPADDAAEETADAADVDLEDAVVDLMAELDDGDGADHDAVVAAAVDRYGAAEDDVEEAIDGALMSGMCFEPTDGTLKAI